MSARLDAFECRWQPSRLLPALHLLVCVLAVLAICLAGISLLWQCAAFLLLILHFMHLRPLLRGELPWQALRCDARGWQIQGLSGDWQTITVEPGTLVLPQLVVLQFRLADGRRRQLCLPSDALDAYSHRRLRLHLRWAHCPASGQLQPGK